MDIQELLKEATKDTLSDENLQKITEAVQAKANEIAEKTYSLKLEAALAKQDTEYAEKLETFLEDVDNDHAQKMKTIIEGMDAKHFKMLQDVISRYKTQYFEECKNFKNSLVTKVDKFFDIVVEEQIPKKELTEAVENIRHRKIVEEISKIIGIDRIQQNKLVKEGLMDAKQKMDTLNEQIQKLKKLNQKLVNEQVGSDRQTLLAQKTKGLPRSKKLYIEKVLGNKSIEFINENFDLTLKLYDEEDDTSRETLKREATSKSKVFSEGIDVKTVKEEVKQAKPTDMYMEELSRI